MDDIVEQAAKLLANAKPIAPAGTVPNGPPPKKEPLPFEARYPNLYGAWGMVAGTAKDIVPYLKYVDPSERDRFMKLSQEDQTMDLLLENLNAVLAVGAKPIGEGIKAAAVPFMEKYLPKTYKLLTRKMGRTPMRAEVPAQSENVVEQAASRFASATPAESKPGSLPKFAGRTEPDTGVGSSVNLTRLNVSDEAKTVADEAGKLLGARKVQTWEESNKLAKDILADPDQLKSVIGRARDGAGLNTQEQVALRTVGVDSLIQAQASVASAADDATRVAVMREFSDGIFKTVSTAASEQGRALNILRQDATPRLAKAFSKLGRDMTPKEMERFKTLDFGDAEAVTAFANELKTPKLKDYLFEYWYNAILSGVPTHVVNLASNTVWAAFQLPHRALAAGVDAMISPLRGGLRTRFVNEVVPMMSGYRAGFKRGASAALSTVKGELNIDTKWARDMGSTLGAFDRSPYPALRFAGKFITPPTKALRAMDVWANATAYDGEMKALARRAANLKGLKGDARTEFETKLLMNPTKSMHEESMKAARYATFTDEPDWFAKSLLRIREQDPTGISKLVVPFVITIGNILKRGVEMTPGVGLLLSRGQNPSEVIAKQIEGSVVSLYMLTKAAKGEVTGGLPQERSQRESFYREGKQPWAIKIGDKWISYRRMEPFNTVLASTATAWDSIKNAKDDESATDIFLKFTQGMKNNLIDSSYLQGVQNVLNRNGQAKGGIERLAAGWVPYSGFWRSVHRAVEAYSTGSAKVYDNDSWQAAFAQTLPPGTMEALGATPQKPRIDVWGKPIELQGGVLRQWLPWKWSKATDDPLEKELARLEIYPGMPSNRVNFRGKDTDISENTYREYAVSLGAMLKEKLTEAVLLPDYKTLSDERKKQRLERRASTVRGIMLNRLKGKIRDQTLEAE